MIGRVCKLLDSILSAYIIYERSIGKESKWANLIAMWPTRFDVVMDWTEEELDVLQDSTLKEEALGEYSGTMDVWSRWFEALSKHPLVFKEEEYTNYIA